MRILHMDRRDNFLEVLPEDREDLFLLSLLLEKGDVAEGMVLRRIKREDERGSGKVFKIRVKISVEEVEYGGPSLRLKGKILEGPEDLVGRGKYQTLEVREGDRLRVWKKKLDDITIEELKAAERESKHPPVLVVSLSDDEAYLGSFRRRLESVRAVRRKDDEENLRAFFGEVLKQIDESDEDLVVVGGPKVIIDEFRRFAEERGGKKINYVVSPISGEKGLKDIISKRATTIIRDERRRKVEGLIDEFLMHLSKGDGLASTNVEKDVEYGNIRTLLVHEDTVRDMRDLMRRAKETGGDVFIVLKDYQNEGIVKRLGGAVGIRRYSQ